MILGPLMDASYRRAMVSARDQIGTFLIEFVTSPISLVLTVATAALLVSQTPLWAKLGRRRGRPGPAHDWGRCYEPGRRGIAMELRT